MCRTFGKVRSLWPVEGLGENLVTNGTRQRARVRSEV